MTNYKKEDLRSYLESIETIAAHYGVGSEIEVQEAETLGELTRSIFDYSQEISNALDEKKINPVYDSRNASNVMEEFKEDVENLASPRAYDFSSLEAIQLNSLYVTVAKNLGILEDIEWNSESQPLLVYQDGESERKKAEALEDLITGIEEEIRSEKELLVK